MGQKSVKGSTELARAIKLRRNELGLTIEEAAARAGVGTKTWSRYEAGNLSERINAGASARRSTGTPFQMKTTLTTAHLTSMSTEIMKRGRSTLLKHLENMRRSHLLLVVIFCWTTYGRIWRSCPPWQEELMLAKSTCHL